MAAKYLLAIVKDENFQKLKPHARLVYFILRAHKDKKSGVCWPSLTTIGKETGVCRQTICKAIRDLEAAGLIIVELKQKKNTRINVYTIIDKPEITQSTNRTVKQAEHLALARQKKAEKGGAQSINRQEHSLQNREHSLPHRRELYTMNSSNGTPPFLISQRDNTPYGVFQKQSFLDNINKDCHEGISELKSKLDAIIKRAETSGALVLPGYINGSARAARLKRLAEQGEKIRAEAQG